MVGRIFNPSGRFEKPSYRPRFRCNAPLGQADEGLPFVRRAFEDYHDPRLKALSACHIALGECQRGNRVEARSQRDLAQKLDPRCFLMERVVKALATVAACR